MNLQLKMSTNYRLWAVLCIIAFISLGLFQLHIKNVENDGPTSFWHITFWALQNLDMGSALMQIVAFGALIFVPAVAIAWVAQAIVVVVRSALVPENQISNSN